MERNMMRRIILFFLAASVVVVGFMGCVNAGLVADHTAVAGFDQYKDDPDFQDAIESAKQTFHVGYGHTSHGSQITSGMTGLNTFMNNLGYPHDLFAWNNGGSGGALDLEEGAGYGDGWLDHDCGYSGWDDETRYYLDGYDPGAGSADHSDVNVIMWSWCGQVNDVDIQSHYLDRMTALESEYPHVTFIYMTGHLEGYKTGDPWFNNNNAIRAWVAGNPNRVLFDFADIEKYNPDQKVNYADYFADDHCDYDSDGELPREEDRNWATDWQNSHTEGTDWYSVSCAHSVALNCNQKAKAFWWMMARMAGWSPAEALHPNITYSPEVLVHGQNISITGINFGEKARDASELWDAVENIPQYNSLSDGDTIPTGDGYPWNFNGGKWGYDNPVRYDTTHPQRGVSTAQYSTHPDAMGGTLGERNVSGPDMYLSWWWMPTVNWELTGQSNKILRADDGTPWPSIEEVSWRRIQFILYEPGTGYIINEWPRWNETGGRDGEWNRQEIYFDNGHKRVYLYTNGFLVGNYSYASAKAFILKVAQLGVNPNGDVPGLVVYMDDIYLDSTQARVEICNESEWNESRVRHCEIQIPVAWSDMQINFTVNQGSFKPGEQAYLFVIDANGTASEGYPVTFGGGGHNADLNDDGIINMPELMAFIARWKAGDGVSKTEVEEARDIWFTGGMY